MVYSNFLFVKKVQITDADGEGSLSVPGKTAITNHTNYGRMTRMDSCLRGNDQEGSGKGASRRLEGKMNDTSKVESLFVFPRAPRVPRGLISFHGFPPSRE
jgi:hypothetical protein